MSYGSSLTSVENGARLQHGKTQPGSQSRSWAEADQDRAQTQASRSLIFRHLMGREGPSL